MDTRTVHVKGIPRGVTEFHLQLHFEMELKSTSRFVKKVVIDGSSAQVEFEEIEAVTELQSLPQSTIKYHGELYSLYLTYPEPPQRKDAQHEKVEQFGEWENTDIYPDKQRTSLYQHRPEKTQVYPNCGFTLPRQSVDSYKECTPPKPSAMFCSLDECSPAKQPRQTLHVDTKQTPYHEETATTEIFQGNFSVESHSQKNMVSNENKYPDLKFDPAGDTDIGGVSQLTDMWTDMHITKNNQSPPKQGRIQNDPSKNHHQGVRNKYNYHNPVSIPFAEEKKHFAMKAVKSTGKVQIISHQKDMVIINGTENEVKETKIVLYEALHNLLELPLDVSIECGKMLSSSRGNEYFKKQNMDIVVIVRGSQPLFVVEKTEEILADAYLKSIVIKKSIDYSSRHNYCLNSKKWMSELEALGKKFLVIVTTVPHQSIVIEGIRDDVEKSFTTVKQLLDTHITVFQKIPLKRGVARFLHEYGKERIEKLSKSNNVKARVDRSDTSSQLIVSGSIPKVKSAEKVFAGLIDAVKYDKFYLATPGIHTVVTNDFAKKFILGLEKDKMCVIEIGKMISRSSKDLPPAASAFHSQPAVLSGHETQHRAVSARDTNPRFSRGESFRVSHREELLYTCGEVNLYLTEGDITKYNADALVNTMWGKSSKLDQSGTVSSAFIKTYGRELQQEYDVEYESQNRQPVLITLIKGRTRGCKMVVHMKLGAMQKPYHESLTMLLCECVKQAVGMYCAHSIAFPAIGTGSMDLAANQVIGCFRAAVNKASANKASARIVIVAYGQETYRKLFSSFKQSGVPDSHIRIRSRSISPSKNHHSDVSPHGNSQHSKTERTPQGTPVVFHVNCWDVVPVSEIKRQLENLFKQFVTEYIIQDGEIANLDQRKMAEVNDLSSTNAKIIIDKSSKEIRISGMKDDVSNVERKVKKIVANIRRSAAGNKAYLLDIIDDQEKIPDSWKHFNGLLGSVELLMRGDCRSYLKSNDIYRVDVETLLNTSWRKDVVGQGKDASRLTHTNLDIISVERIENPKLWRKFSEKKKEMLLKAIKDHVPKIHEIKDQKKVLTNEIRTQRLFRELVPDINEVFLFHGTSNDNIKSIEKQGFESRLGNDTGMFGRGIYFAESATKSDQYSDTPGMRTHGDHKMILARVLLGHAYICTTPTKFVRPPCRSPRCMKQECKKHSEFFDSVIGTHRGGINTLYTAMMPSPLVSGAQQLLFREFIVYDNVHCYPEFVITYRRK